MTSSNFDADEPADDEDTGPLQIIPPGRPHDPECDSAHPDPARSHGYWAGRFDAPLTVSPRQVQGRRGKKPMLVAAAALGGIAVVGGLIFWLTRPSSHAAESSAAGGTTSAAPQPHVNDDEQRLLRQLPRGYATDACTGATPPEGVLAQVNCGMNSDPGGPLSAIYTLVDDKAGVDAVFGSTIAAATQVNCPGNIQSPGPWRRNATPDTISGQLYCGLTDSLPIVVWTDEARKVVSAVRAGPQGPTFPQLYAWWSSHS